MDQSFDAFLELDKGPEIHDLGHPAQIKLTYFHFLDAAGLRGKVSERLAGVDVNDSAALQQVSSEIKELIELSDRYQVKMSVATGGTLARRIIVENKPEGIVAVACEHDLTTGIQDAYPIPVIGILNERPNGPCINTKVDIRKVKRAILDFIDGERDREILSSPGKP